MRTACVTSRASRKISSALNRPGRAERIALPNPAVPGYVEVDARTAWAISNTTEISLAAFNLLDAHHVEFGGGPGVSDLRRRFSLRLLARF